MMSGENIRESIGAAIRERISDPLLGAFAFTFVLFNYDHFLILIFDKSSIAVKVEMFHKEVVTLAGVALPFVIALLYVFLYPYVKKELLTFVEKRKLATVRALDIVKQESIKKYPEYKELERSWKETNDRLKSEVWRYKEIYIDEYKKQNPRYAGNIIIANANRDFEPGTWVAYDHKEVLIEARAQSDRVAGMVLDSFVSYPEGGGNGHHFAVVLSDGEISGYDFYNRDLLKSASGKVFYLSEAQAGAADLEEDVKRTKKIPLCTFIEEENRLYIHPGRLHKTTTPP